MTFTTGLTIQKVEDIQPSQWIKIALAIRLKHIEFDQTVFDDLENILKILKSPQTTIHAPYVEDYGIDLSSNNKEADMFVDNVTNNQQTLNIIGVVVHPPTDASGSWDKFYERVEKLPLPLLENMPYQSWEEFQQFFETTQANTNNQLGFCFDIPHSWMTHGNNYLNLPDHLMDLLKAPTGYIHISGGTREEDTHYPLLTDGDMPIEPVKDFFRQINFSGTVTMELRPRSLDDLNKIFRSYMFMLATSGRRLHRFQVKILRPFIMRKVRQMTTQINPRTFKKREKNP